MRSTVVRDPGVEVGLLESASSRWAKSRRSSTIFWIRRRPSARAVHQAVEVLEQVGEVDLLGQVADPRQEVALVRVEGVLGLLVEAGGGRAGR